MLYKSTPKSIVISTFRSAFTIQKEKEVFKMIKITLKDGSIMEVENGTSIMDVAKKISEGLARVATCGTVNSEVKDLRFELNQDCNLTIETFYQLYSHTF